MKVFVIVFLFMTTSTPSQASIFGEESAILIQILEQAVQQLAQLQMILNNGQDTLGLLQDINRGLNDSLNLAKTIHPYSKPELFGKIEKVKDVLNQIQSLYGTVANSPEATVQSNTDQVVAEAIGLNNSIYDYSTTVDELGEEIKDSSHRVSPGGAAKLTAQSIGVMIHVMNQQLRAQATGLKLQAQGLAAQKKREKDQTAQYLNQATILQESIQNHPVSFKTPRF